MERNELSVGESTLQKPGPDISYDFVTKQCKRAWMKGARSKGDERHITQYVKETEQAQRRRHA